MKGLIFKNNRLQLVRNLPLPQLKNDDALIHIKLAGICKTDQAIYEGYMNFEGVLGHEFVGVVKDARNKDWVGKRVVGEINIGCNSCEYCQNNMSRHCLSRSTIGILDHDGCFAEFLSLPVQNLHAVPPDLPDEAAVFTEPLAAALEILEQRHVEPDHNVLVIGDGNLGFLIALTLVLTGCRLIIAGKHEQKLSVFRKSIKNVEILNSSLNVNLLEELQNSMDIVVEASGSCSGLLSAIKAVKPRGTIILKSTYNKNSSIDLTPFMVDEICLLGSRCGPFKPAVRLLAEGLIDPIPWIQKIYPLDQAEKAFCEMQETSSKKILLRI